MPNRSRDIAGDVLEYYGNKRYIDEYNANESEIKGSQIGNWSHNLFVVALSHINPFTNKKQEYKVFRQQRSYEKMKLSLNREKLVLNKSISAESIRITSNHYLDNELFLKRETVSKNCSYDSISNHSQSDTSSEISSSNSLSSAESSFDSSSISSCGYGSVFDITVPKNVNNVKVVERFGDGYQDLCLFPLVLKEEFCDLNAYEGKLTWDSILGKADLILDKFLEYSANSRKVNRVLPNASDFVCPDTELEKRLLLNPRARKPLKRWNSFEDLLNLSHEESKACDSVIHYTTDDTFYARHEFNIIEKETKNENQSDYEEINSSKTTDDLYELKRLDCNSSPLITNYLNECQTTECDAKSLIKRIKIRNPLSLALQITESDKEIFKEIKNAQLLHCIIGNNYIKKNMKELDLLLEFGQELNRFVICVIRKEVTPETQGKKLAAFVEVGCALRRLRNFHSLCIIIKALQSPKIYFMEEAWMQMKRSYPIHFKDYIELCRLVRKCEICVIGTTRPNIPSIKSMVSNLTIHCIATWDLLESKRRWTEQTSIAGWLNNELIGQLVESHKRREKQEDNHILITDPNQLSLLPMKDPIRLIHNSSLPKNWNQKDMKFIPDSHFQQVIKCYLNSFNNEINLIRQYNIPEYYQS